MNSTNKKRITKLIVPLLLIASLLVVVTLGENKQAKASRQLLTMLNESELKKNYANSTDDNKKSAEKETVHSEIKKVYTYTGANALGQYNSARWRNKKWYAVGDNIKNTNAYVSRVKALSSINTAVSDALDGRTMGDMAKNITSESLKDVELITIFGGANDYVLGTPIGTLQDDVSSGTFYGNLKKVVNEILEITPSSAIVFITPLKQNSNTNKAGAKIENYVRAIHEVCKSYNILVLDLYGKSGIDEKNIKSYTTDNLTLTDKGIQKISQIISDYIKTIK
jgi:hypothetical protein